MKKLLSILMLLVTIVTGAWATDFVDTYGSFGTVTGDYVGNGISKIKLGDNAQVSSGIQATDKDKTLKFTVSTPTGFTIKTVRFKNSNVSGTPSTNDAGGTVNVASSYTTYTASSNKSSVEFTVASSSGKQAKLTEFTVTVTGEDTEDYELITPSSIADDGSITYTSSLGDDKLVTSMSSLLAKIQGSSIDFGNGKGFSITTSRAIKAIYCVWHQRQPSGDSAFEGYSEASVSQDNKSVTYTDKIGTYTNSTNAWIAPDDKTKYVAFKRTEGSSARLSSIHIFYYDSNVPSVSASNVNITEYGTDAGEIAFTVDAKGTTGSVTAETDADWVTLGDVADSKVPFTATANTESVSRSATVTLTYTYNTSATVTKEVTINQEADAKGTEIIKSVPSSYTSSVVTGSIGGTHSANDKLQNRDNTKGGCKMGNDDAYIGITLTPGYTFRTGDVISVNIGNAANGTFSFYKEGEGTNAILITSEKATVGLHSFVLPEAVNGESSIYLVRKAGSNFNPYIDYISVTRPNAVITLNAKGYATYSAGYDFEYKGADAYGMKLTAASLSGTKVTTGKIQAGEGILFKGEANATVAITETTGAEAIGDANNLIGTTNASEDIISSSYTYKYALSGDTFKKLTGPLVANKAFFGTNEELSNSLDLIFDGATAINNVNANDNANSAAPVKVIKNGKLYIGNYNVAGQQVK